MANVCWQQELGAYPTNNGFGTGSSPAIYEGIVFVQHFTSDSSLVAAFNTHDGVMRWKHERSKKGSSWSSPIVCAESNAQRIGRVAGNDEVDGLDRKRAM